MKIIRAVLMAFLSVTAYSQDQKCTINLDQSPTVRGLKLGMSVSEAAKVIPELSVTSKDEIGYQVGVFSYISHATPASLKGVYDLTVQWLDDRAISIHIRYDDSMTWGSVNVFSRRIGESLGLPAAWKFEYDYTGAMRCDGFDVATKLLREAELTIKQTDAEKAIVNRKKELDEKRQKDFKP